MSLENIILQMKNNLLNPPLPIIADGRFHRFRVEPKDTKESGWYIGFLNHDNKGGDYYVFVYGDWHMPDEKFTANSGVRLDKRDKKRVEEQIRRAERTHHQEKVELQRKAAELAQVTFSKLSNQFCKNEYLEKKGLSEMFGARASGADLIIPMQDIDGVIRNIETISFGGTIKKGLYGGQRTGLFHIIGELGETIYLAEGFATGASVHLAMKSGAVVTFNAGNLPPVAEAISKKFPNNRIVICGDNDQHPNPKTGETNNVGAAKAEEAANVAGGKFVIPQFANIETRPTDFNDLHMLEGLASVRSQILKIEPQVEVLRFDRSYIMDHPYPDENEATFTRKGTMVNVAELLFRLRIKVRYNIISKEEEVIIPGVRFTQDNQANASLACILDWCARVKIPTENLTSYLTAIADTHTYNPVADWIESKPWDGESRLERLYATITAKGEQTNMELLAMKEKLIRTWMISGVAAAYESDGISAQGVLVLQGDQYLGKTRWFLSLVPKDLKLTADGITLNPDDDDSVMEAISKWLVELGEMDGTLNRSDAAKLKAFLTKTSDELRKPYAKKASKFARRTIFFGSVNEMNFLKDPTGNRRFWVIECEKINHEHNLDMQQVWAEIKERYRNGEPWHLTPGEIESLNEHNENFQALDSIEERIRSQFDWSDSPKIDFTLEWMTATEVCQKIGIDNPKNSDARAAGTVLRKLATIPPKKVNGSPKFAVYLPPPSKKDGVELPW